MTASLLSEGKKLFKNRALNCKFFQSSKVLQIQGQVKETAMEKSGFEASLQDKLAIQKGVYFPVKASLIERLLVKKLSPNAMLPNAEDDFCVEGIGPSYKIISEYENQIRKAQIHDLPIFEEPVIVEKLSPKNYRIMNGHHRWAAAYRLGIKHIHVLVVNLSKETDIRSILERSTHNKRAVFDLDEVLLRPSDDPYLEPPLLFPFNLHFRERLRMGVPALFYFLKQQGYDIWIYSSTFYSNDDVEAFFRHYHANIDGAITGFAKRTGSFEKIQAMFDDKYAITLHIDNESVLLTQERPMDFALSGNPKEWSGEIMDIVKGLHKDEKESG